MRASVLRSVTLAVLLATAGLAYAGAFISADDAGPGVNSITHPTGYTGVGGPLVVTVCVDPTSPNAGAMEVSMQNIVQTWNALTPASPNLFLGGSNDIPSGAIDFESVALHELGHCIGLHHPNLANESGLGNQADYNYTKTTTGPNTSYDLGIGTDAVRGSGDDARGDDVNLHWFEKLVNDPFTLAGTVDGTTYSRNLADLPGGDTFAANADRTVGALLGYPDSEAVMQQGAFSDEDQRQLAHDDVATLRLGMSGVDMIAGTGDDYTLQLVYGGIAAGCHVNAKFQGSGLASCATSLSQIGVTNHWRIVAATMSFGPDFEYFFTPPPPPSCPNVAATADPIVLTKTLLKFDADAASDKFKAKGTFSTATPFDPSTIDTTYVTVLSSGSGTLWSSGPIPPNTPEWASSDPAAGKFVYRDGSASAIAGLKKLQIKESPSGSNNYKLIIVGGFADLLAASPTSGNHQVVVEFSSAPLCLGVTATSCKKTPPVKELCK